MDRKQCKTVQAILIKERFENVAADDQRFVQQHLADCETCQKFRKVLLAVSQPAKSEQINAQAVVEEVRQTVATAIKQKQQSNPLAKAINTVLGLFNYKIPVYQPVLVVIILLIFLLPRAHFPAGKDVGGPPFADSLLAAPLPEKYRFLIDNIELIKAQRVGETVKEDSALFKYSYTVF
jgi:hypothetical protein